jgi:hypothetical protein
MIGIAGLQVGFKAREPIVAFFAAVSGYMCTVRLKLYFIFGLKFPFANIEIFWASRSIELTA